MGTKFSELAKTNNRFVDYLKSSKDFYDFLGLDLNEFVYVPGKSLSTTMLFEKRHCGYKGIIHGGVTASLIDVITGVHAMIIAGEKENIAFTRRIKDINFHHKITSGSKLYLYSELGNRDEYEIACSGHIMDIEQTKRFASGLSLFVEKPII